MSAGALFEQPITPRLNAVVQSIKGGELLFPEFQRPFLWKDDQRLELFDSIVAGLPIGSFLVWRTSLELGIKSSLGPFPLPPPAAGQRSYVLDGMQRLSTLYAALAGGPLPDMDDPRKWPIFYDLRAALDEEDPKRFKIPTGRLRPPLEWLPLSSAYDSKALWAHQKRLYDQGLDTLAERAEELSNRLKDYTVAIVPIATESLSVATLSFQRVNSAGTRMDEFHMLRALVFDESLDLTRRVQQLGERLPWGRVKKQTFVQALKADLGQSVYQADLSKVATTIKTDSDFLPRVEGGMADAVNFCVDRCRVHSEAALPYAYQLVALARAAAMGLNINLAELERWFWVTTFTEYFTGKTAGQLKAVFEHVEAVCGGRPGAGPPDLPRGVAPISDFNTTSVRARALMHLLARRDLIDFEGQHVDGPRLIARGTETFGKLFVDEPSKDPANRILVVPEDASATRAALLDPKAPVSARLRDAHVLPPWEDPASATTASTLAWRRQRLHEIEADFIRSLGLEVLPVETGLAG